MAITYEYSLTEAVGLPSVLYFYGLDFPVVIAPTVHGKPLLTRQAFYYLEQLESVARVRFERGEAEGVERYGSVRELKRRIECIIDNYLFEFSKKYPSMKVSGKVTEYKYWEDGYTYQGYDGNYTKSLTLDIFNDPSLVEVYTRDFPGKTFWSDWNLVENYLSSKFEKYVKYLRSLFAELVFVNVKGHEELGTGVYFKELLKAEGQVIDCYQADMLDVINVNRINPKDDSVLVSRGLDQESNYYLPLEVFKVEKIYDSELLSYYFAGVRETLPISKFRCFYNVLEASFEGAVRIMGENVATERQQLNCLIQYIWTEESINHFLKNEMKAGYEASIQKEMVSSSGEKVTLLKLKEGEILKNTSSWLYDIRCACMHSKKRFKGNAAVRLVPYTTDEDLVDSAIPIIQKLAVLCIEKANKLAL